LLLFIIWKVQLGTTYKKLKQFGVRIKAAGSLLIHLNYFVLSDPGKPALTASNWYPRNSKKFT
jgi:hypothetical protein